MRVLIGALVLCLCVWSTHTRAQDWRSDQALWTAAARTAPLLPRPALNLAAHAGATSHWDEAWRQLRRAVSLGQLPRNARLWPATQNAGRVILHWIDAVDPRCDVPSWRSVCVSLES